MMRYEPQGVHVAIVAFLVIFATHMKAGIIRGLQELGKAIHRDNRSSKTESKIKTCNKCRRAARKGRGGENRKCKKHRKENKTKTRRPKTENKQDKAEKADKVDETGKAEKADKVDETGKAEKADEKSKRKKRLSKVEKSAQKMVDRAARQLGVAKRRSRKAAKDAKKAAARLGAAKERAAEVEKAAEEAKPDTVEAGDAEKAAEEAKPDTRRAGDAEKAARDAMTTLTKAKRRARKANAAKNEADEAVMNARAAKNEAEKMRRIVGEPGYKDNRKLDENDDMATFIKYMNGGACMRLGLDLLGELKLRISSRHNAKWGLVDVYRFLVAMCADKKAAATAEGQHRLSVILNGMALLPTRTWMLNLFKMARYDYILARCTRMIARSVMRARRHGMLRQPVDVSIDMHKIPVYTKTKMINQVFSKKQDGTIKFTCLVTIHCVTGGSRLTLGVVLARTGDNQEDIVDQLLDMCAKNGIKISSVTMDRGFDSTRIVSAVKRRGHPLVMPIIKRKGIKKILESFDRGEIGRVTPYVMTSADKQETEEVTLVIADRKQRNHGRPSKEPDISDKYTPFITTMSTEWIDDNPEKVGEFYKRRWGIENSYKSYESIRPWTTSTSESVRILVIMVPFILYNIWTLCKYMLEKSKYAGEQCALYLFIKIMFDILNQDAIHKKPPDIAETPPVT